MNMFRHPFQILEERGVSDVHAMEVPQRIGHEIVWNQEASQAVESANALEESFQVHERIVCQSREGTLLNPLPSACWSGRRKAASGCSKHPGRPHAGGPVAQWTVTALKAHRDRQEVERLVASDAYAPHGFGLR